MTETGRHRLSEVAVGVWPTVVEMMPSCIVVGLVTGLPSPWSAAVRYMVEPSRSHVIFCKRSESPPLPKFWIQEIMLIIHYYNNSRKTIMVI